MDFFGTKEVIYFELFNIKMKIPVLLKMIKNLIVFLLNSTTTEDAVSLQYIPNFFLTEYILN